MVTLPGASDAVLKGLVVKTVQLKITAYEEHKLDNKRKELQALFPGLALSDTTIVRHLVHKGLGLTTPEKESDYDPDDDRAGQD